MEDYGEKAFEIASDCRFQAMETFYPPHFKREGSALNKATMALIVIAKILEANKIDIETCTHHI